MQFVWTGIYFVGLGENEVIIWDINLSKLMVNNTNDVASVVLEIQYLSFQVEYKNNDVYSIRRSVYVGIPVSFDLYLNISNSLYDANGNLTDINWQNN